MESKNNATARPPIVYSCSGCSDAGELADCVARELARRGVAEMSCIAGVGGRVKPLLMKAQNAERILAIDGCPLNCVANTLRVAEVKQFEHLQLQELGFRKGDVAVTDQAIQRGVDAATEVLTRKPAASS